MPLGACYYPEQWPEAQWAEDAGRMVETGINRVRIGEFAIPPGLAPGPLKAILPITVTHVESLPPGVVHAGEGWEAARWLDHIEGSAAPEFVAHDGTVAGRKHDKVRYLSTWPEAALIDRMLRVAVGDAGLEMHRLPEGLRLRSTGTQTFAFN